MPFVDTNVLLYGISTAPAERAKAAIAREILERRDLALSAQVLQEFYVQATRESRRDRLRHDQARILVADDPEMFAAAERLFVDAEEAGEPLYLTTPVLCELVWTLRGRRYHGDEAVVQILDRLLATPVIEVQDRDAVQRAIRDFESSPGDFADYLIGHLAREAGCSDTITFDRHLQGSALFSMLE